MGSANPEVAVQARPKAGTPGPHRDGEPAPAAPLDFDAEAHAEVAAEAEEAMWRWYLLWSGIARVTIHDRNVLRALGYRKVKRSSGGPPIGEVAPEPIEAAVVEDDEAWLATG